MTGMGNHDGNDKAPVVTGATLSSQMHASLHGYPVVRKGNFQVPHHSIWVHKPLVVLIAHEEAPPLLLHVKVPLLLKVKMSVVIVVL